MTLQIEGVPGQTYTLRIATPWKVTQVTGLPDIYPTQADAGIATIDVTIPGSGHRYRLVNLEITFEQ